MGGGERHWLLGDEYRFGVGLGLTGAALVAVGFAALVAAERVGPGETYWLLREAGGVSGALGAAAAVYGVTVTLAPRRPTAVGGVGVVLATLATGMFVAAYPTQWNTHRGADLTAEVGALYLAGLGVLGVATAMAVRRARYRMGDTVDQHYAPEESGFVWSDDGD